MHRGAFLTCDLMAGENAVKTRFKLLFFCEDASCDYFVWNASGEGDVARMFVSQTHLSVLKGSVRTCSGSAPAFSSGPATKTVATGVRGSALADPGKDFRFQLNAQPLCQDEAFLMKASATSVEEAASACQRMDRCTFFGFFAFTAKPTIENRVAFFCSAEVVETVSPLPGWVTGVKSRLLTAPEMKTFVPAQWNGPILS